MSIWIAILLGIVQGLCEFLPVSSSGHLLILNQAFGIEEGGPFFSIMLHMGTLVAVFFVYRKQIWELIKKPIQKKTLLLVISTVVTVIIYVVFKKVIDTALDSGFLLGYSFLFTAAILLVSDRVSEKRKNTFSTEEMKIPSAIGIGLMQGIGILPGVSRSGSTIAGAKVLGLKRENAAEYSFLLSIPAILGGLVTEIPDVARDGIGDASWLCIIVGMVIAAATGYFAVRFMIKMIANKKLWGFAIYVGILGILVLIDMYYTHFVFNIHEMLGAI